MLAVEVELLTGRYTATQFNDRQRPEWPPHPARLFSALVATWADADEPDADERAALEWLEALGDPEISCSSEAVERTVVTHYVPDNDTSVLRSPSSLDRLYEQGVELHRSLVNAAAGSASADRRVSTRWDKHRTKLAEQTAKSVTAKAGEPASAVDTALKLLPEGRGRQGRTYPTVRPLDPVIRFGWADAPGTGEHRAALDGLLARVARLGHSSSLVTCRVVDEPTPPTYVPETDAPMTAVRVPAPGLLRRLEQAYESHQGSEPRSLPARSAGYRKAEEPAPKADAPAMAGDWFVLALAEGDDSKPGRPGRRQQLSLRGAAPLCRAVRGALVAHADEPVAEILSGHRPGSGGEKTPPSERPHVAVVPLPFVGHPHADGSIKGVAVVLPRADLIDDAERRAVLRALGVWRRDTELAVNLPGGKQVRLELADEVGRSTTLSPRRWRKPSRRWASVTPVALDRHPGDLRDRSATRQAAAVRKAQKTIAAACEHAGLPQPASVSLCLATPVQGVPHLRSSPPYRSPGKKIARATVHALVEFDTRVDGPVLLGAGRYYGYGLFAPVEDPQEGRNGG